MAVMNLKRRGTMWPTVREAWLLPEPTFKGTATLLELAPLHMRGEYGW